MKIGVLAQREYLSNGLQTFESNVVPWLLQFEEFEPIYHDFTNSETGYPFSETIGRYKCAEKLKEEASKYDKVFIPAQNRLVFNPQQVDCEVIPYVHDVLPYTAHLSRQYNRALDYFLKGVQNFLYEDRYIENITKLDQVIVASERTKQDLEYRTTYTGDVEVIYQGVSGSRGGKASRDIDLLYVGSLQDRKNPEFIREVFDQAFRKGFTVASVNYNGIDLPGRNFVNISDEKLDDLYSRSRFYLHSTFNEGFGRTPVEAQRHGCVPLGFSNPINNEVLGDAGRSWKSIEEVDDVIRFLQRGVADEMRGNAVGNSERFRWERTRNQIKEVLLENV